jgi:hypothetical protein
LVGIPLFRQIEDRLFRVGGIASFASNSIEASNPLGYGVALASGRALTWCNQSRAAGEEREFVNMWVKGQPEKLEAIFLEGETDDSDLDLTADTAVNGGVKMRHSGGAKLHH